MIRGQTSAQSKLDMTGENRNNMSNDNDVMRIKN